MSATLRASPLRLKVVESNILPADDEARIQAFERPEWNGTFYTAKGIDVEPLRSMFLPSEAYEIMLQELKITPRKITCRINQEDNQLFFGYSWETTTYSPGYLSDDEWIAYGPETTTSSGYRVLAQFPADVVQKPRKGTWRGWHYRLE